jgi:hypothetical protein
MNTISMHRKYSVYTQYLDTMLEHSVVLLEGESKLDAYRRGFKELDQIAAELRKEAHQDDYGVANPPTGPISYTKESIVPVISTDKSPGPLSTMTGIQNSKSLEELTSFKLLASGNRQLYDAYCSKLKELNA